MLRLAVAGLLALVCFPAYAVDLAGIEAATLMLYKDGRSVCTTSVVHSGEDGTILLTAAHCLGVGATEYSIRIENKDEDRELVSYTVYMADVFKKDASADLAVLRLRDKAVELPATEIATAEEADAALFKGAEVLVAGYPHTDIVPMGDLVYTEGLFTGLRDALSPETTVPVYRTTAPIWYGKSGGALYTKIGDSWKLVGVSIELNPELPWETSIFVPVEEVEKILRGAWVGNAPVVDPNTARETLRNK